MLLAVAPHSRVIPRPVASVPLVAPRLIDALIGGLLLVSLMSVAFRSGDFISKLFRNATEDPDVGAGDFGSQLQVGLNILMIWTRSPDPARCPYRPGSKHGAFRHWTPGWSACRSRCSTPAMAYRAAWDRHALRKVDRQAPRRRFSAVLSKRRPGSHSIGRGMVGFLDIAAVGQPGLGTAIGHAELAQAVGRPIGERLGIATVKPACVIPRETFRDSGG